MRILATVLLIALCFSVSFAQENFKAKGGGIIWEKTYPAVESIADTKEKFKRLGVYADSPKEGEADLRGASSIFTPDITGAGYTNDQVDKWLLQKDLEGTIAVTFYENSYTVKVSDMWMRQRTTIRKELEGMKTRLVDYAYNGKKADFEKSFIEDGAAAILNKTLLDSFDLNKASINRDF